MVQRSQAENFRAGSELQVYIVLSGSNPPKAPYSSPLVHLLVVFVPRQNSFPARFLYMDNSLHCITQAVEENIPSDIKAALRLDVEGPS
jgi:hypothetical protein